MSEVGTEAVASSAITQKETRQAPRSVAQARGIFDLLDIIAVEEQQARRAEDDRKRTHEDEKKGQEPRRPSTTQLTIPDIQVIIPQVGECPLWRFPDFRSVQTRVYL
jgi:hypothetical protein